MHGQRTFHVGICLTVLAAAIFLGKPLLGWKTMATHRPTPEFHDWSTRHVAYSNWGFRSALNLAEADPRAGFSWRHRLVEPGSRRRRTPPIGRPRPNRPALKRDWSINLGIAGTAPGMYPAKFSFDVTQAPSCATDYVVYPIAAKGSATQPNLVAFNNLYSGTGGPGNGICNRAKTASDLGNSATTFWSYNIQGIVGGGAVPTSPVLSFDLNGSGTGTKVAFVESLAGSPAHFHVLAWNSGDGKDSTNLQNVLKPKTVSTFSLTAPAAGSGAATDLPLGISTSGTDTLSSPFVDYARDLAYVGNDLGILYRIKDVFCPSGNPHCTGSVLPAPSLDSSWGTAGAVTVCSGALTGPVLDFVTLNVYVGCSDGKLYSVSQTGTVKSITVGDGIASKAFGAIVDPPIVDSVNGFVYAVSGSANNGANGVLVQAKVDFSSWVAVPVGAGNQCNIRAPALTNAYYISPVSAASLIYVAGVTGTVGPCTATGATGGNIVIYGATFGPGGVLNSGAPAHNASVGSPGNEFAPLTEFFNANAGAGQDFLFFSVLCTGADMDAYNVSAGWSATFLVTPITEGLGTSGMVVDNNANTVTSPQASSIYFNALNENAACTSPQSGNNTGGCAIKLTQAALQ